MINVTKTYLPEIDKYIEKVKEIFNRGWLTNNGEFLQELENKLKDFLEVDYLLLVSNGTSALQLISKLFDLNGKIITTPFSFVASVSSFFWEGLEPVFADIDSETYNMDPSNIDKIFTPDVSAIVPVHVFGNPCKVDKFASLSGKLGVKLIYDASHAFGVRYNGKNLSFFGDAVAYSFHSTKLFHTIEGGAVIVRERKLYEKAKLIRNFGIPGYDQITELGVNFKMNEFEAAMGLCVLNDIDKIIEGRRKVYCRYMEGFETNKKLGLQKLDTKISEYNFAYFPVLFENEIKLHEIMDILCSIEVLPRRYFYPSLEKLPYLRNFQKMPVADNISSRILCLPVYYNLEMSVQDKIIEIINQHV
jgi:dTDP-4-amino-4,6-dideoxygalactose transaminase